MKNGVLVVAAMPWEAGTVAAGRPLRSVAVSVEPRLRLRGRADDSLWVLQSGIGPALAASATTRAIAHLKPAVVVSTGCAGALCDGVVPGEVVIAEEVLDGGRGTWRSSPTWVERYEGAARESGVRARRGRILTSGALLSTGTEKRSAGRASRCDAVDMETAVIADAVAQAGAEFVVVRAILDVVDATLPEGLVDEWGRVRLFRVLRGLFTDRAFAARLRDVRQATRLCQTSLREIHRRALS